MKRDFSVNEKCFVRENRECGRILGGSKMVFIATPSSDYVALELDHIKNCLKTFDIEPYVAVDNRTFGKDIFCEKICGKIIESLFCIVILNDEFDKANDINIPNPNVYYEYGLMTSLNKKIIPLQKDDERLAFNIQSLDTIKYNPRNFLEQVTSGIKSILIEPEITQEQETELLPKNLLLYFGLHGITWPQIPEGSDIQYALRLGFDLGFFLLINLSSQKFCYVRILKNDEDEDNIILYIKTLLHRISPLRDNVKRQINEMPKISPELKPRSPFFAEPSIKPEDEKTLNYLKGVLTLIDNIKIFIYRDSFRERGKIGERFEEIRSPMSLPELSLIDEKEIDAFIFKQK